MIQIEPIEAFSDNYIWLLFNPETREAAVVDPGDHRPVETALATKGLRLTTILVTHHHMDHIGGITALAKSATLRILGPASISHTTEALSDGSVFELLGQDFTTLAVPGHTLDHLAFFSTSPAQPILFCGDTLFAGGCGRLFEGTPEVMYWSLQRLASLPAETRVYCAHEYTLANLAFARAVEPDNAALAARLTEARSLRAHHSPTVPSTLAVEQQTNPFLRCQEPVVKTAAEHHSGQPCRDNIEVFAKVRAWKDNF